MTKMVCVHGVFPEFCDLCETPEERTARAFGRPKTNLHKPMREPPASESFYWRPKGETPQDDAAWLKAGNLGEKR